MDSFVLSYVDKCREFDTEPISSITTHLTADETTLRATFAQHPTQTSDESHQNTRLSIRSRSLNGKASMALAAALKEDQYITTLDLSDTYLGDVGCSYICDAMLTNTTITHLDLRGNNIRAEGATALAKMLRINKVLQNISLEWNCLGLWEAGFRSFMEAVASNKTLVNLDLRNNRIGPTSGSSVAMCLKVNETLRRIDLRWNNLGILGGRDVSDAMKWNYTLTDLELGGNDINEEAIHAVDIALVRNREAQSARGREEAKALMLQNELELLKRSQSDQLRVLEKQRNEFATIVNEERRRVTSEQEVVIDLQTKLSQEIRVRNLQELRVQDLELELEKEKKGAAAQISLLEKEIMQYKSISHRAEENNLVQMQTHGRDIALLETKLRDAEKERLAVVKENTELCALLNKEREASRSKIAQLEDTLLENERNHKDSTRELNVTHEQYVQKLTTENEERFKMYNERITIMESNKLKAEQTIDTLRAELLSLKIKYEDQFTQLAARYRQEEDTRVKGFQDKINEMKHTIEELKYEIQRKVRDNEQLREEKDRKIRELERSVIAEKDAKSRIEVANEQLEKNALLFQTQIEQLKEKLEICQQSERNIREQIGQIQREYEGKTYRMKEDHERTTVSLREHVSRKDSECDELKQQLLRQEKEHQQRMDKKNVQVEKLRQALRGNLCQT